MAGYKVPQDVEAEDKLLGPFSFRQFIYLMIVAFSIFITWILAQVFLPLVLIPLPVILFFGALALPLKKDQPMEAYLAAMVQFFLKPKKRVWKSDGTQNLVEIVAPKTIEQPKGKDISQDDAMRRFDYLAQVMDTRGWSTRGVNSANDSINSIVMQEAATTSDILDESTGISQSIDSRIHEQEAHHREEALRKMYNAQLSGAQSPQTTETNPATATAQTMPATPTLSAVAPEPVLPPTTPEPAGAPVYNPYPTMHQRVIAPHQAQQAAPSATPETSPADSPAQNATATPVNQSAAKTPPVPPAVSPAILGLAESAESNGLSISAISNEAHRLEQKAKEEEQEVVINLR